MSQSEQTVHIVDDDDAVRDALELLIQSVGLPVETWSSATEFLEDFDPQHRRGCLVLDIRMPGMSGLDLQKRLIAMKSELPIIFITGHGDVAMAVHAMQAGAADFLLKPFREQELLDRIHECLDLEASRVHEREEQRVLEERIETLTPREREVFHLVVEGSANKVIAARLKLSKRTIELHRAKVMEKMQASSLAQLVRMAIVVGS